MNQEKRIENFFKRIRIDFEAWLKGKPTGKYAIEIKTSDGAVRGDPKVDKQDDMDF